MTNYHVHTKEFIIGAAVGGILGSVAALLAAPKSGTRLRQDICDAYCDLSDKTGDLAKKGKHLAKNVSCQTCDWVSKAKSLFEGISNPRKFWHEDEDNGTRDLLIGGLAGSIIGAVAGLLLAPKSGEDLRDDLIDTYHDVSEKTQGIANGMSKQGKTFVKTARSRANKWLDLAQQVVEELTEKVQDTSEDLTERAKQTLNSNHLNDIMDWASLGLRVWKGLKAKR